MACELIQRNVTGPERPIHVLEGGRHGPNYMGRRGPGNGVRVAQPTPLPVDSAAVMATQPQRSGPIRRATLFAIPVALLLGAATVSKAQDVQPVVPVAETQLVRQAAFTMWWPHYERLMRQFRRNTPSDEGQIALPEPTPQRFLDEIEIIGRIVDPTLGGVSLYSVTTEGQLFEALFVVGESNRVWPLVNRVDPEAFQQDMSNDYVDAINALLDRETVRPSNAEDALRLARLVVEVFYNFDYRYRPASVDSLTFAELNLVRVLRSTDEIPQGLRRFDSDGGNALLYGRIPDRARGTVSPPRVVSERTEDFQISFYSWHPQSGELKRWDIRLSDGQFESLKDQTVEKWVSFTVENF